MQWDRCSSIQSDVAERFFRIYVETAKFMLLQLKLDAMCTKAGCVINTSATSVLKQDIPTTL